MPATVSAPHPALHNPDGEKSAFLQKALSPGSSSPRSRFPSRRSAPPASPWPSYPGEVLSSADRPHFPGSALSDCPGLSQRKGKAAFPKAAARRTVPATPRRYEAPSECSRTGSCPNLPESPRNGHFRPKGIPASAKRQVCVPRKTAFWNAAGPWTDAASRNRRRPHAQCIWARHPECRRNNPLKREYFHNGKYPLRLPLERAPCKRPSCGR